MARQKEYPSLFSPGCLNSSNDWLLSSTDDNDTVLTSFGGGIWDIITPPSSPPPEYDEDCFAEVPDDHPDLNDFEDDWSSASTNREEMQAKTAALSSQLVIQDCMWSGSDGPDIRTSRSRKVSLSELTMLATSTSCIDPTSVYTSPRAQNQMEHSYSLTTPEPLRIPAIMTPASTDDSGRDPYLLVKKLGYCFNETFFFLVHVGRPCVVTTNYYYYRCKAIDKVNRA